MINWKAAAKYFWKDSVLSTREYVSLSDAYIVESDENERLRAALTEIANCNGGEGYMPGVARKALGGGPCST